MHPLVTIVMGHHSCWAPARGCYLFLPQFHQASLKTICPKQVGHGGDILLDARYQALGSNLSFCIGVAHKTTSPTTSHTPTTIRSQISNSTCSNPLAISDVMSRILMLLLLENVPRHPPMSHPYPHNTSSSTTSMD
jgi:hypothetical protein